MAVFFVYVHSLRGPEPQRWVEKPTNGAGVSKAPLQCIELPDTYAELPLQQLVQLYPYKGAFDVT